MDGGETDSDLGDLTPKQALDVKHKAERKELQSKIQALKKGVPKGDKKKAKDVKAQIAILESELAQKHDKELSQLEGSKKPSNGDGGLSEQVNADTVVPRISKAQKKRDKKALQAKEQYEIAALAEKDYVNTLRYAEEEKIKNLLAEMKLQVKPMVPDGNCLYYAIVDQLKRTGTDGVYNSDTLRRKTADYMLTNADDFMPFLTDPNTGDCFDKEQYVKYCDDIANTAAWGGQLELRAMSHIVQTPIHVVQADVPRIVVGEEYHGEPIILTYHRHELGLGEHYNSVKVLHEIEQNDSWYFAANCKFIARVGRDRVRII